MSSKKKGGKKAKKEKSPDEPKLDDTVDETSKQFYLIQIRDLEEKLKRYQVKSDELEILCKNYEGKFTKENADKRDIVGNLQNELTRKTFELNDLNDRLIGLQQAKDAEKETFEKQLADLRQEYQEMKDSLTNQINSLSAKLTSLEEFKAQKEELLAELQELKNTIESNEKRYKADLYELEKKEVLNKDRLKKEMIVKVNQVAADFRRVSNKQMADTTKRAIKENVSINTQLQKMSQKIVEIIADNDQAKQEDKQHKQQLILLEDNEKELARKNVNNVKIIRMLTDKCKAQESIIVELEEKCNEMHENEQQAAEVIEELGKRCEALKNVENENEKVKETIKKLQEENVEGEKYRSRIEKILKEATSSLTLALSKNVALAKSASVNDVQNEDENEWNLMEKRDFMLENMLILLNSAASLGFGPKPSDFSSDGYQARPRTRDYPGSGKGLRKHQIPPSPLGKNLGGFNPHYQLGDLGLVPRSLDHVLTNTEKVKYIQPNKELGSLQKVLMKSTSTQTLDVTKASVFTKIDLATKNEQHHPIFDNNERKGPSKTQIFLPMMSTNRVKNTVF